MEKKLQEEGNKILNQTQVFIREALDNAFMAIDKHAKNALNAIASVAIQANKDEKAGAEALKDVQDGI